MRHTYLTDSADARTVGDVLVARPTLYSSFANQERVHSAMTARALLSLRGVWSASNLLV